MAYELGGVKKRPWWDLLLESFGAGVGFGGGGGTTPGAQATLLGGSPAAEPAAAPAAKTPGVFTAGGVTYGSESMGLPPAERVALDPEEIARRRAAFKPERSRYAAKRRETLLEAGEFAPGGPRLLGADDPRRKVSWRAY